MIKSISLIFLILFSIVVVGCSTTGWTGPKTSTYEMAHGYARQGELYYFMGSILQRISRTEIQVMTREYSAFLHAEVNLPSDWIQGEFIYAIIAYEGQTSYQTVFGASRVAGRAKIVAIPQTGWFDPDYRSRVAAQWKSGNRQTNRGNVGIKFGEDYVIKQVISGSPAARYGLLAGDTILTVDGNPVGEDYNKVIVGLTGIPGTSVVIEVLRVSERLFFLVTR